MSLDQSREQQYSRPLSCDATGMEANAAMKRIWRWKRGETHQEVLEHLAE